MKTIKTTLLLLAALPLAAHAGTGWNTNDGGALQFLEPANWDEGDVNGVFPAGWAPAAVLSLRLTNDWTGSFSFLGSIAKDTTFYGRKDNDSGAQNRTITLEGDLLVQPSASAGKLVFDATVGFDLGGETRSFLCYAPSTADKFRMSGPIANGNLVLGGNGAGMTLVGNASVGGDILVGENTSLVVNWATAGSTVHRANDLELRRATLAVSAYKGDDTAEIDAFRVSGRDVPGVSLVTIAHNNYVGTLRADSLEIADGGTLAVMANDLGAATDAAATTRLMFVEAPALAGDAGAAGTPGVAVLPGVVVGTAANALPTGTINNSENYNGLFLATYDAARGVRRLSDDEIAFGVSDTEAVNLVVTNGAPLSLAGDAAVNSLQLWTKHYRHAVPEISGDGTLTVKSGMVLMTVPKNGANLNVSVDFGTVLGRFFSVGPFGEQAKILKPVHGTGGLVFSKGMATSFDTTVQPSSSARGFAVSTAADYTGDTYVQCVVEVGSNDFLPHGTRSGDTIVNGCLSFGSIAINGLFGTGAVRGTTLAVGEDGSDGDFAGTMAVATVNKVGAGTQRLSGTATGTLNANAGTLLVDGALTGSANVADGGAIGGDGEISGGLTFSDGGLLAVTIADGAAPCLDVTGAVTGPVAVSVSAEERVRDDFEACVLRSGSALPATFRSATKGYKLELRENDTELWLIKIPVAMLIVVK